MKYRKFARTFFTIASFLSLTLLAMGQPIVQFHFDEVSGDQNAEEAIGSSSFYIDNNFNFPERISGVSGNALRFDGWSTWIEMENFAAPDITKAITIECWYATESFTAANSAIISQEDSQSGFSLEVEPYGKLVFIFWADNTRYVLVTESAISKYAWNHIVATIDLDAKVSRIFVNNVLWKELPLGAHDQIMLSPAKFYIGRDTDHQEFAGFSLTMMNGALDELTIYKQAFSSIEVQNQYELYAAAVPDLRIDPSVRHADDHLRPQYHAMPNTSWTNEPYGLTYYNGKYHLFFQKNPNGPYLYFMHWGHLTSSDLVSWQEEKIALAPSPGFDSFGVWSGTTIEDSQGKPVIFYTGVDGAKAGIGMAESIDETLLEWVESEANPVIAQAPSEIKHLDFRDPFLWKAGDIYYMIVGSGLQFNGGGYLFTYKSANLSDWTLIAPLYNDTNTDRSGFFWEMPFFHQINDEEWMLCVTPTPSNVSRAKSIYWIGEFHDDKFIPHDVNPRSLELISDNMLAPSIGIDENGKMIYLGIVPEDRDVNEQIRSGWRHIFSLPREIRLLNDSTVGQIPHPNLCRLREQSSTIDDRFVYSGSTDNLPEVSGNQLELKFKIKADPDARFSIQVLKNEDESEYTSIHFDLAENTIELDRRNSSLGLTSKDNRGAKYVFDHQDSISVHAFIDHSVLEVFVDNLVVFSARVYPTKLDSHNVDLIVENGQVKILKLEAWTMKDMVSGLDDLVCQPSEEELPTKLRKEAVEDSGPVTGDIEDGKMHELLLYPNPATRFVRVVSDKNEALSNLSVVLLSSMGEAISHHILSEIESDIDVSHLPPGLYYAKVFYGTKVKVIKLIVLG